MSDTHIVLTVDSVSGRRDSNPRSLAPKASALATTLRPATPLVIWISCGCSSMVEPQPSKLMVPVRSRSPAPVIRSGMLPGPFPWSRGDTAGIRRSRPLQPTPPLESVSSPEIREQSTRDQPLPDSRSAHGCFRALHPRAGQRPWWARPALRNQRSHADKRSRTLAPSPLTPLRPEGSQPSPRNPGPGHAPVDSPRRRGTAATHPRPPRRATQRPSRIAGIRRQE